MRNVLTAGLIPSGRAGGSFGRRRVVTSGDGIRASARQGCVRELQRGNRG